MTRRTIVVDNCIWKVYPTGRITVYGKDEFGLLFELGTGPERKRRFTRYSPLGSKSTDASLAELTERQLLALFHHSQPPWTSPDGGHGAWGRGGRREWRRAGCAGAADGPRGAAQRVNESGRTQACLRAGGGKKLRYVGRTWAAGGKQEPPRRPRWLHMNLPLYSPM